ncbi:hypothetical protein DFQ27_003651 [Actinomortierella ambigua]|uniref:Cation-transporting ATPase n=1 Tax=Actinomortierella ambigua TaxID=1343610 RepID=A0A9P6U5M4_9FUNG|nr:hypothetical protein DFQ27_003651 [Actinomortierella ambigua]
MFAVRMEQDDNESHGLDHSPSRTPLEAKYRQPIVEHDDEDDEDDEDDTGAALLNNNSNSNSPSSSPAKPGRSKLALNKRPLDLDLRHDQCQQRVYLEEEDIQLTFTGYRYVPLRRTLYYIACVLSVGILFLLGRWLPKHYIRFVAKRCDLSRAEFIVVENEWGQFSIEQVFNKYYGGPISSVFNPDQLEKTMDDNESDSTMVGGILHDMQYFDYRYIRFIYNPVARQFMMNCDWKDVDWTTTANCERGIGRETHQERLMVFGPNVIDVQEKTVGQLLVQEVLHPFYIFQVFSMILWFLDDYYYYAACIFLISTISVVTELVDTKRTMRRMRAMSRFTCSTKVFRSGRWRYLDSEDLVPGDIFEVTDSELLTFPCDALLLTGDCIVNESMLTGESVPVSKIPVSNQALQHLDLSLSNMPPEMARHFLFCGTKIIRARPGSSSRKTPNGSIAGGGGNSNASSVTSSPGDPSQQQQQQHLQAPQEPDEPPRGIALVVRTGFNTTKGTLVRSMLFPKPNSFKFYRDSFRFIGILSIIAGIGFLLSLINFIRMGVVPHLIVVKALDLITIVVPPALPATMSIGTSFAIARLKRSNIFCISPTRVNVGGKIDCMCFDKTGTLTEEGLDVLGVQCPDMETGKFGEMSHSVEELQRAPKSMADRSISLLFGMATCHSVKSLSGELIGDPLDLKMFEFTKWILEEGGIGARTANANDGSVAARHGLSSSGSHNHMGGIVSTVVRPPGGKQFSLDDVVSGRSSIEGSNPDSPFLELGIIRCFEFVSSLRRMSVIVKRLHNPGMEIFVKGAPEVMTDICTKASLPLDYHEQLMYYTHHGYRVIACAAKSVPTMNFMRAQRVKREQVESELQFLGFIVFENKLKPTTAPIIATLANARIRQIMCTGDNALTAISVSRECGLIAANKEVYAPRFVEGDCMTEESKIVWENVDNDRATLDPITLMPSARSLQDNSSSGSSGRGIGSGATAGGGAMYEYPGFSHLMNDYALAVTGDVFRWMVDYAPTMTLNRMLVKGQIFARMSPDEKHELVEHLQALGYCVGFCGDGANDCGALKAADVGISLSEAEASVAAPFTSRSNDIGCVVRVIQEGRAALVTSFSCFKYMALYSLIQFTTVSFLYVFASNLGDFQFLYIDLLLILPIAVVMGRTEAYPVLHPKRPTANLISKKVLTSLLGNIAIQALFQVTLFILVRHQPFYTPPIFNREEKNIECYENTALFTLSSFQYLFVAVVFSVGPPFRKPMVTNRPLIVFLLALVGLTALITLVRIPWLTELLEMLDMPFSFRVFIVFLALLYFVVAMTSEKYLFPIVAGWIGHWMARRRSHANLVQDHRGLPTSSTAQTYRPANVGYAATTMTNDTKDADNKKKQKTYGKVYKQVEEEFMFR